LVAERGPGDEYFLVDAPGRRRAVVADREAHRVSLGGIDRKRDSDRPRDGGAADAEREHVGVGSEHSVLRDDARDPVSVGAERANGRGEADRGAQPLARCGEASREDLRVAATVRWAVEGPGEPLLDG